MSRIKTTTNQLKATSRILNLPIEYFAPVLCRLRARHFKGADVMRQPPPPYEGSEPYIFVCYAHEDEALVYPELSWLASEGFRYWYDEGISPGENWPEALASAIGRP